MAKKKRKYTFEDLDDYFRSGLLIEFKRILLYPIFDYALLDNLSKFEDVHMAFLVGGFAGNGSPNRRIGHLDDYYKFKKQYADEIKDGTSITSEEYDEMKTEIDGVFSLSTFRDMDIILIVDDKVTDKESLVNQIKDGINISLEKYEVEEYLRTTYETFMGCDIRPEGIKLEAGLTEELSKYTKILDYSELDIKNINFEEKDKNLFEVAGSGIEMPKMMIINKEKSEKGEITVKFKPCFNYQLTPIMGDILKNHRGVILYNDIDNTSAKLSNQLTKYMQRTGQPIKRSKEGVHQVTLEIYEIEETESKNGDAWSYLERYEWNVNLYLKEFDSPEYGELKETASLQLMRLTGAQIYVDVVQKINGPKANGQMVNTGA